MKRLLWSCLIALFGWGCQAGLSGAAISTAAGTAPLKYYDGERWREIYVSNSEVAEFAAADAAPSAALRALAPKATLIESRGQVRYWRLEAGQDAPTLTRSLAAKSTAITFSPVFYRSAVGGPRLSLGGGVVVRFPLVWKKAEIDAWAQRWQLRVVRAVLQENNIYLIASAPGMAALELANKIQESGEVESATPQWWVETFKR
ncbi:MAG: hypothetical protein HY272_00165 [Gammaproteobacteria bacterium]|nr:hypothetical protein [Gammaproteobacteria bacterium]